MKNIRIFLSENFRFLFVKFSIHLNRHVFVMYTHLERGSSKPLKVCPSGGLLYLQQGGAGRSINICNLFLLCHSLFPSSFPFFLLY